MCEVVKGLKVVSKYNEELEVVEKLPNKRCMVKFLVNDRMIEVYNCSVKEGCSLKHEYTKSYKNIGMLGYVNQKEFPHSLKERQLWKTLMDRYASKSIEHEEYCVFKDFCLKLRELEIEDYNKLMNNTRARLVVSKDGKMIVEDNESKKPVRKVHIRTGKVVYYNSLEDCAQAMGLNPRHVKEHYIKNKNVYRGYKIEFES